LAVVAFVSGACTSSEPAADGSSTSSASQSTTGSPTGSSSATEPTLSPDEARSLLLSASFDDPATLDRLDARKGDPAVVAAAEGLAPTAAAGGPRWAVVYVLANATGTAESLAPFIVDPDLTIKVMASIGAVGQGDKVGFAVLVDALTHDAPMAGFEPPTTAWVAASLALARHTGLALGPALDADPADRDASVVRWKEWLAKSAVEFDPATEEWR
jgi:hypothetical protein